MVQEQVDICIIGAGPAGATAALFLGKMGIPHLLLDAETFPRDKICGDGLDLKVTRVLRQLDPELPTSDLFDPAVFLPSRGTRFFTQNGRHTDFVYRPKPNDPHPFPLFHTAKRLHFDHWLLQKLDRRYTDFRPGTRVTALARTQEGWEIQAQNRHNNQLIIKAKLILGADGDHSVVLRHLGERSIERRHYAGAVRQYWKGIEGHAPDNLIEVYFPKNLPMSYFYIFPLPNGEANVGYGMVSELIARHKVNLRHTIQTIIQQDPVMAPRFRHAIPLETPVGWGLPLASRRRRAFGDRYLLAGDAASLVCPTSGEGIGTAMISGLIAAHFFQKALTHKRYDADFFKNYDQEIYRRLEDEIRLYNAMMHLSPFVYDRLLNWLAPNPLFQLSFQRRVKGWLHTAYEKGVTGDWLDW